MAGGYAPPTDFVGWERALTEHFLMVGPDGDAGPIRSFEVTGDTFARAAGWDGGPGGEEALARFKRAVSGWPLINALEDGHYSRARANADLPGCFSYLVLTLAVAAFPDPSTGLGGKFREKLKAFTGIDRSFADLHGVDAMWRELQAWLEKQQEAQAGFRRLVLPVIPPSWNHIGYSLRLAFPTKPDATLLTNFFTAHPEVYGQPRVFIHRFAAEVGKDRVSYGMKEAFKDFREAFLGGDRLLLEHPLWRLAGSCAPRHRAEIEEVSVRCLYDEDGIPSFSLVSDQGSRLSDRPLLLSEAIQAAEVSTSATTLSKGFLLFHQVGYGTWQSIGSLAEAGGRTLLGCSGESLRRLQGIAGVFAPSGSWFLSTEPLKANVAERAIERLGGASENADRLTTVRILGGVRVHGGWLGRPGFLPKVAAAGQSIAIKSTAQSSGDVRAEPEVDAEGAVQLTASTKVEGPYFAGPLAGTRSWSRRISFAGDAYIHDDLDCAAATCDPLTEWGTSTAELIKAASAVPESWEATDRVVDDLAEAIYAGGRSGWDEGDLVDLARSCSREVGANPWTVIRTFRDARFLQPRLRSGWRGRIWTLNQPAVRDFGPVAVVEGAICERHAEEWRSACLAVGAKPFRNRGIAPTAPLILGCVGAGARAAADTLGWCVLPAAGVSLRTPMFMATSLTTVGRQPASRWDWDKKAFVADGREGDGPVGLTRWSHVRGADHDVYVVKSSTQAREHKLLSRGAAVALAHAVSRLPLFKAGQGVLTGLVPDACLPDGVAARLRLRHVANAGLVDGMAAYACDTKDVQALAACMPGLIENAGSRRPEGLAAVSFARHARGRIRLEWRDGVIAGPAQALGRAK